MNDFSASVVKEEAIPLNQKASDQPFQALVSCSFHGLYLVPTNDDIILKNMSQ